MLPVGLAHSILATIRPQLQGTTLRSHTMGVLPTDSSILLEKLTDVREILARFKSKRFPSVSTALGIGSWGSSLEGAWYAKHGGKLVELYTILHLPYTSMVLSYVLIGAALSPTLFADRLALTMLAYFLGLGFSAHALNELKARHWGASLSRRDLQLTFLLPFLVSLSIGLYGVRVLYDVSGGNLLPPSILAMFILLETFFLFAYNTNYANGKFHGDLEFAFAWALLPFLTSYYVHSLTVPVGVVLIGLALLATAMIEINLSRWCKSFRRRSNVAEMRFEDGSVLPISTSGLIRNPEKALKLIVVVVDLLGIGLFVMKLVA